MNAPDVGILLDIDREYREKAASGVLQKISPRYCNPWHEAWLPVLHTRFGPWRFTALYSNTERAHGLHRTHDWVVISFSDDERDHGQATVVTEYRGVLEGRRVVRGRERECAIYYRALGVASSLEPSLSASDG
jgi:DNA polymerase (family X)